MKIVIITETLHVGGAETFVVRLCNALVAHHEVYLINLHPDISNPALIKQIDEKVNLISYKIPVRKVWQKGDSFLNKLHIDFSFFEQFVISFLKKQLIEINPDVVHSHLFHTDLYVARSLDRIKLLCNHVITIHGDYSSFYFAEADARMQKVKRKIGYTIGKVENIVCICEEHMQFFTNNFPKLSSNKLHQIFNGYKPSDSIYINKSRLQLGLPEDKFIFGMVSRGVPKKGWEKAIHGFLKAKLSNSILVLVGWSDYMADLKQKYSSDNILFLGFSANPIEYIQHFDVCLLPTLFHYESLPTVVIEYLYCSKPVIATNVGEISKMISTDSGSSAGILLNFINQDIDIGELASAMRHLHNTGNNKIMSELAHEAFQKFDMDKCVEAYLTVYKRMHG